MKYFYHYHYFMKKKKTHNNKQTNQKYIKLFKVCITLSMMKSYFIWDALKNHWIKFWCSNPVESWICYNCVLTLGIVELKWTRKHVVILKDCFWNWYFCFCRVIDDSIKNFKAFFRWLYVGETEKLLLSILLNWTSLECNHWSYLNTTCIVIVMCQELSTIKDTL